jgi:hypothetical protein
MKFVLCSSASAIVLALSGVAAAQSAPSSCPPGSWFCAEPPQQEATPAGKPVQGLQPLPDPDDEAPPPPRPRRYAPPPPVVVYQPPPPVIIERPETPPPYEYAPPPRKPIARPNEWGLNLHLEGAAFGSGVNHDAGMGGLGGGLRYKPKPQFGIEADLDFLGGHDYLGDQRSETSFAFNALFFVNPKDRAQVYFLGGFGWSWAHVTNDPSDPSQSAMDNHYSYFGGQAGIGLELRLTRVLAFNGDVRGFIRSRTDNQSQNQPEFVNANGQVTNTSGGALFTGGMTLYF